MKKIETIIVTRKDLRQHSKIMTNSQIYSPMDFKMSHQTMEKAALIIFQYGRLGESKVLKCRFGTIF